MNKLISIDDADLENVSGGFSLPIPTIGITTVEVHPVRDVLNFLNAVGSEVGGVVNGVVTGVAHAAGGALTTAGGILTGIGSKLG